MSDAVNECSKELNEKGVQIPPEQLCFDFSHFSQSSCKIAAFFFFFYSQLICLAVHLRMLFCTVISITPVVIYMSQSIKEREGNRTTLIQSQFALVGEYKVGRKHHVYKN